MHDLLTHDPLGVQGGPAKTPKVCAQDSDFTADTTFQHQCEIKKFDKDACKNKGYQYDEDGWWACVRVHV